METLRQIRDQSFSLFGGMQPHQRLTFVALALIVLVPFGWLIFSGQSGDYVPLQWGAAFDSEKLRQAEQALIERGLDDFRTVGQRIQAPADKVDEYNAALSATGNWSPLAESARKQALQDLSIFLPRAHFDAHMDVHLQNDVARILRGISGIRNASVLWSRAQRGTSRFRGEDKASVFATPSGPGPLTPQLVQSLRMSVCSVMSQLTPEHVVVVDQSTGKAWTEDSQDDLMRNERESRKREIIHAKQTQIQSHLNRTHPGAVATVNVVFDNLLMSTERQQEVESTVELASSVVDRKSTSNEGIQSRAAGTGANQPRSVAQNGPQSQSTMSEKETKTQAYPQKIKVTNTEYAPLDPQSMQVVVSIPEDHIETLVLRDGAVPGTTDEEKAAFRKLVDTKRDSEIKAVREMVSTLLPGATPEAVTVSTFRPVDPDFPQMSLPFTEIIREFAMNWGSTLGLAAFVIWALMMVKKSMPVSETAPSTDALDRLAEAVKPPEPVEEEVETGPSTPREFLEDRVRNNPAIAADVLAKMLQGV